MEDKMGPIDWLDQIGVTISNCDEHGITTFMNRKGSEIFAGSGGYQLIGKSMVECHPEGAVREKFINLLKSQNSIAIPSREKARRCWFTRHLYSGTGFSRGIMR
jgi:hypothetical protein